MWGIVQLDQFVMRRLEGVRIEQKRIEMQYESDGNMVMPNAPGAQMSGRLRWVQASDARACIRIYK